MNRYMLTVAIFKFVSVALDICKKVENSEGSKITIFFPSISQPMDKNSKIATANLFLFT